MNKLLKTLFAGMVLTPVALLSAGCDSIFVGDDAKYETGVNINLTIDSSALEEAAKVQLGYSTDFTADVYGKSHVQTGSYIRADLTPNLKVKDIYFSNLKDSVHGYELKDMILYLNVRNYDNKPLAVAMSATSQNENIEFDCEQIEYVQELASGYDPVTQTAAFRIMYKNDIDISSFMADIDLNVTLSTLPIVADTQGALEYTFDINKKTAIVSSYNDITASITDVKIPRFVNNPEDVEGGPYTVTEIKDRVFYSNQVIKKVYMPDTLEKIGYLAFYGTTALEKVYMSDNLKYIGRTCFNSSGISGELYLPQKLEGFVDIPSSVESADDAEQYTGIQPFYYAKNLTKVVIPEGIKKLPMGAFWGCSNLKTVILPTTLDELYAYENGGVRGCLAFRESGIETIDLYNTKITSMEGLFTFYKAPNLKTAYLPKNSVDIGIQSFYMSTALENVVFPTSLETVADAAFYGCSALKDIVLPVGTKYLKHSVFANCSNLENISMPEGLIEIGCSVFGNCKKLKTIDFPDTVEYLGSTLLNHCPYLENEVIVLPSNLKQVGGRTYDPNNPIHDVLQNGGYGYVFYNCGAEHLKAFEIAESNPYYMTIDGVLYLKENGVPTVMIAYPAGKKDSVYIMPDTVVDAHELSLSRPYYLSEIVLSDSFIIKSFPEEQWDVYIQGNWANNLSGMIYVYCGVSKVTVKATNPNYKNIGKGIYSKDGKTLYWYPMYSTQENDTITIAEGTETIFAGALVADSKRTTNEQADYFPGVNKLYGFKNLVIPASVKSIDPITLSSINCQGWTITVAEGNTVYEVVDGKLVSKA